LSIPVPNLDDRTHAEIVEEALRLIPQYCPDWTNFNPSDPGVTLIELFAWMTEMAIYRLNKVTDKNFIAFLNLLGVKLQAPQPAHTLLRFDLVAGAPATWVKTGSPVATVQSGREEPVVFETGADLLVTGNVLARCFTQVSDEYADHTPFVDGRRDEGFEVFGGVNHIERSLYVGDERFAQVGEDSMLVVRISSAGSAPLVDLLEWAYWNGRRWREMQRSLAEVEPGAIAFEGIDSIEPAEVNGVTAPWIRGRLVEAPPDPHETIVDSVLARVEVTGEGLEPAAAYVNLDSQVFLTVDFQRAWAPFGKEPRIDQALYVLPSAMPAQPGSVVRIEVQLADPKTHHPPQHAEDLSVLWEYYDGKKWRLLGRTTPEGSKSGRAGDFVDGTAAFTCSGEIRFRRPENLGEVEIQNEPGPWLRARIEAGDFGVHGQYELDGDRWIWRDERPLRPPWVRGITFRYSEEEHAVTNVVTYNDFAYFDHSTTARTSLKTFQAFEPSTEDSPALYLGFAHAFPNESTRIYFQMQSKTSLEADHRHHEYLADYYARRDRELAAEQRVVWEYWSGQGWSDLAPADGTRAFTESGFLDFTGPDDHKRSKRFGEAHYWVRARLEMGGYHQMPRITQVLLDTVEAYHHTTVSDEVLGSSDGTPNQAFRFVQGPLLSGQSIRVREKEAPEGSELAALGEDAVEPAGRSGHWVRWCEVDSFYESDTRARHYIIDRVEGVLRFGDGRKGLIPAAGSSNIVAAHYRVGGGTRGNVTRGTVIALRKSVAHIEAVTNPFPAAGGSDQESVEEAKARGPHVIKSRDRAVTGSDFEWLAMQASNGIARARCLNTIGREGEVSLVVVPKQDERRLDLSQKLVPSTELLRRVKHFLDGRRLLTTMVHVVRPRYVEVSLEVWIIRATSGEFDRMKAGVSERLRRFLHPLVGGRDGAGWDFGRNVLKLDLHHVVEDVDGVDVVDRVKLFDEDRRQEVDQVKLAPDELVHLVHVTVHEKARERFI